MAKARTSWRQQAPTVVQWANVHLDLSGLNGAPDPQYICRCNAHDGPHRHLDWEAFNYRPAPLCLSGGYGSAKTVLLCRKALYISDLFPGNRGVIARKIAKELESTTQATFFKTCPPGAYDTARGGRRADSENVLRLCNGSEIRWMHLDDQDIDGVIRGLEINWFLIDQAEEIEEEVFDQLSSRLGRWDQAVVPQQVLDHYGGAAAWPWRNPVTEKPLPPSYAMLSCNPGSEVHWIYRRFHPESPHHQQQNIPVVDPQTGLATGELTSYQRLGYKMFLLNSLENRFLPVQARQALLQSSSSFQRRFVRGEWGLPEGQIHEVSKLSLVPGTPALVEYLRQRCTLHRSMDHGSAAPTVVLWWAVDREGNVFCYREYYEPNQLISNHRANIAELSGHEQYVLNLADPSIGQASMQKHNQMWSIQDEYADRIHTKVSADGRDAPPIYWQLADNKEQGSGTRSKINEYLRLSGSGEYDAAVGRERERIHPLRQEMGLWPSLFFVMKSSAWPAGCWHAPQQLAAQRYDRAGTEAGRPVFTDDRDETVVDHAYDAIRYFMASRAPAPRTAQQVARPDSWLGVRERHLRDKRRGKFRMRRGAA